MRTFSRIVAALLASLVVASAADYIVYVGTYSRTKGKGIYAYRFQTPTGKLTYLGLVAEAPHSSFLAVHPNQRFLYAGNEHEGEDVPGKNNTVSAYSIDRKTGKLAFLNKVSSRGEGPCYLFVDKAGKHVLLANYRSASVAVLPIRPDGRLNEASAFVQDQASGANPQPKQVMHAHGVILSPDNRFALEAETGLDEVRVYRFDAAAGTLTPNEPLITKASPGSGPRHLIFHPNGKFLYLINEAGSTMTAFAYGAAGGTLQELQTVSTLPQGFTEQSATAELQIDRAGRFLYGSNRGHDSIVVFAIDPAKGTLTLVEHVPTQGKTPRYFALDPTGAFLFAGNQNSNNLVLFRVDRNTGRLTPTGQVFEDAPEPSCIVFVPAR